MTDIFEIWLSTKLKNDSRLILPLINEYGSAENIYKEKKFRNPAINELLLDKSIKNKDEVMLLSKRYKIGIITKNDEAYPELLKYDETAPYLLYYIGNPENLKKPLITVTGSRKTDIDGRDDAKTFAKSFEFAKIEVVTGYSQGIEENVIKSINGGIGILPSGIDRESVYPKTSLWYYDDVFEKNRLILSCFPIGAKAEKWNFAIRNKLLAGISPVTLIVQSGEKSGTNSTFEYCMEYGREVFAIPGSIRNRNYAGNNNYLVRGAKAAVSPEQIISFITGKTEEKIEYEEFVPVNETQKILLDYLEEAECHIDKIINDVKLSPREIINALTELEITELVEETVPDIYRIKRR